MILCLKSLTIITKKSISQFETNPKKFLDTRLLLEKDIIKTEVYRKANKFPVHWKSQIPKRYKRNAINGGLYRSWRISSNSNHEKSQIRLKF